MNTDSIAESENPFTVNAIKNNNEEIKPSSDSRRESRLFWTLAILFFAVWTIVPAFLLDNYHLDVVEQFIVGCEGVSGSTKHPALTALVLEAVSRGTGRAPFIPYFVSQLFVLVTLLAIRQLARDLLPESLALAATCAMFNYWFFHFESTPYNNNITLNAAWAVSVVLCWKALKTNSFRYWIFAGLAIGIGLHFKYTMGLFALLMVLFLLIDPEGRQYWKKPGPWLTTLTAFLVFLPHFLWLVRHDYAPLHYASALVQKPGWTAHFIEPLDFTVGQLLYIIPILIPLIPICGWWGRVDRSRLYRTFQQRYLLVVLAAPFLFQVLLAAGKGLHIRGALGSHLWLFLTVWLVSVLRCNTSPKSISRSIRLSVIIHIVILFLSVTLVIAGPYVRGKGARYHFPGKALAVEVERVWHEQTNQPLPWTAGDWWLAGNASVYGKDRARVHCFFSTWGTKEEVYREGGMILWNLQNIDEGTIPADIIRDYPEAKLLSPIEIPWQTRAAIPPLKVGMAIILPETQ